MRLRLGVRYLKYCALQWAQALTTQRQLSKSVPVESAMTVSYSIRSFQLHSSGHVFVVSHGVNRVQAERAHLPSKRLNGTSNLVGDFES